MIITLIFILVIIIIVILIIIIIIMRDKYAHSTLVLLYIVTLYLKRGTFCQGQSTKRPWDEVYN